LDSEDARIGGGNGDFGKKEKRGAHEPAQAGERSYDLRYDSTANTVESSSSKTGGITHANGVARFE
jgi:hypothetical protein